MLVRDLMQREVVTLRAADVTPRTAVRIAIRLMLERKIGCLPVVEGARLVGLMSETDCLRHLAEVLDIAGARGILPELPAST